MRPRTASVEALERWLEAQGLRLPPEYRELLLRSDGLQIGNDRVYSAGDCRWQTEELTEERDARYLAIGQEGNVACWVFDTERAAYVISSFSNPEDVFESYTDLKTMLISRLRSSGMIE